MSIFKDTFIPAISASINARQNALVNRTPQNLQYLNSRNSWIRMTSAVNIVTEVDENGLPVKDDGGALAKKYILQGGILKEDGNLRKNISDVYSNVSPSGQPYRLGIRPMPGITDISIASKSAYGSLREVTVNFVAWDIRQLEDLELLYMRPGYTVLVEWGWAPYLDSDGSYKTNIQYYDIINQQKPKEQIFKEIFVKATEEYKGNYDACFGYVKNYSWSARPDGGYDCQTHIISLGEVIESLKVNYAPFDLNTSIGTNGILASRLSQINLNSQDLVTEYNKNILAGICYELKEIVYSSTKGKEQLYTINDGGDYYHFFAKNLEVTGQKNTKNTQVYITLESFLKILNKYVLLKDVKGNSPFVSLSDKERKYDKVNQDDKSLLCLAHPLQISTDPSVCLISSPIWQKGFKVSTSTVDDTNLDNLIQFSNTDYTSLINDILYKFYITTFKDSYKQEIITKIKIQTRQNTNEIKEFHKQFQQQKNNLEVVVGGKKLTDVIGQNASLKDFLAYRLSTGQIIEAVGDVRGTLGTINFNYVATVNNPIQEETKALNDAKKSFNDKQSDAYKNLQFLNVLKEFPYFVDNNPYKELGIIGNIFLNVDFLYNLSLNINLSSQDKKEKNEISLYDYLKNTMSEVSQAIGNVSNFDIHVDHIDGMVRIIDINYVDNLSRDEIYKKAFELQVHNLRSTVRNYKLESQIFQEQATIVAIGAQTGGGALGVDSSTLVDFNKKIVDRIIPKKDAPLNTSKDTKTTIEEIKNKLNNLETKLSSLYEYFGNLEQGYVASAKYDINKSSEYKNALKDIIVFFKNITKSDIKNRAIIPTKLSLEMDGIGGLVIGHVFKIPSDILPKGYKGGEVGSRIGYIITGIGGKVANEDWTTSIDAQTIILDNPSGQFIKFEDLVVVENNTLKTKNISDINSQPSVGNIKQLWDSATVNSDKYGELDTLINQMVANKNRYTNIGSQVNTPWYIVAIIHQNECSLDFSKHLYNGDSLQFKTIRYPSGKLVGINPPYTFEQSAVQALKDAEFDKTDFSTIYQQLYALEKYNGLGYRQYGVNSPYLWSYTNQYKAGKFVKDKVFSFEAVSQQPGAAAILKRMKDRGIIN